MSPTNPIFAIVAIIIVFISVYFLPSKITPTLSNTRFNSIDGLRGYLAFFVFLHHSVIWYFYLQTGVWQVPASRLFTHFGQASVAVFFMITSFLFFTKLLNSTKAGIDWKSLYISRIYRLVPLYVFSLICVFSIAAILSGGKLVDPPLTLIKNVAQWVTFTFFGDPDLNGVKATNLIIAGVSWSLPYEWFLYFSLPVFAFFLRVKVSLPYFVFGLLILIGFYFWGPQWYHVSAFLGGIIAAYLARIPTMSHLLQKPIASVLFILSILGVLFIYNTSYSIVPLSLLIVAFTIIACGNTLFGFLTHVISRTLGEMAYSIYLIHGIILFITFKFILGFSSAKNFSVFEYWSLIFILIPILITVCYFTFTYIEKKFSASRLRVESLRKLN